MISKYYKILSTTILLLAGTLTTQSQDTTITLSVDTIYTPVKKTITIIVTRTVPKFILHFNAGYNSGAMDLTSHNGGFSRDNLLNGVNYGTRNGFGFNLCLLYTSPSPRD